jgi:hypothetical protein
VDLGGSIMRTHGGWEVLRSLRQNANGRVVSVPSAVQAAGAEGAEGGASPSRKAGGGGESRFVARLHEAGKGVLAYLAPSSRRLSASTPRKRPASGAACSSGGERVGVPPAGDASCGKCGSPPSVLEAAGALPSKRALHEPCVTPREPCHEPRHVEGAAVEDLLTA